MLRCRSISSFSFFGVNSEIDRVCKTQWIIFWFLIPYGTEQTSQGGPEMSQEIGSDGYQQAVERFWHNYMSILENSSSVPIKARVWYRRHVQDYITAHQGVKLPHYLPRNTAYI